MCSGNWEGGYIMGRGKSRGPGLQKRRDGEKAIEVVKKERARVMRKQHRGRVENIGITCYHKSQLSNF
jgi:hypothetical protein